VDNYGVCVETIKGNKRAFVWWAYKVSLEQARQSYIRHQEYWKDCVYLVELSTIPYTSHTCTLECQCIKSVMDRSGLEPNKSS
jgi:hypothetical protein